MVDVLETEDVGDGVVAAPPPPPCWRVVVVVMPDSTITATVPSWMIMNRSPGVP